VVGAPPTLPSVYFTPTSGSWLKMVEPFFRDLTQKQLPAVSFGTSKN
jgi:hypothetical protein